MKQYSDILAQHNQAAARKLSATAEHRLQVACVSWFRLQFPRLALRLFAIPNGGFRSKTTAARLRDEGVLSGVADLFLAEPRSCWGGLFIEMKTTARGSDLSQMQRTWASDIRQDYGYTVCRTIEEFQNTVRAYLAIPSIMREPGTQAERQPTGATECSSAQQPSTSHPS